VDDVLRVPHVIVLTIERANAAPSAAGGANADAEATMESIKRSSGTATAARRASPTRQTRQVWEAKPGQRVRIMTKRENR
jgi:hypothetical protein